ncbi:MAG: DMT family transporter [Thermomicrobiales bacterium]
MIAIGGSAKRLTSLVSLTALGAILVWSGVAPFGKYALDDFPTLAYVAIRPVIGATAIFALLAARHQPMAVSSSDWKRFAVAGALCIGISQLLFIGGLARTSVAHLIILASTSPLLAVVYRWARHGYRPDRRASIGMLLGFLGVIIVVSDAGSSEGTSLAGDLMALGAAAAWVGATVLPQPLVNAYGALRATGWLLVAATMLLLPVGAMDIVDAIQHPPPTLAWASLLYTALALVVGNTLWQRAVQQVGPGRTLVYLYLEPVLALMLVAIFLGERLTVIQAVGGVLAIGGVMLVQKE